MIKLPALLDTIRDLKDRSGKLSFVTRELSNDEFNELRDMRGLEGWILFATREIKGEDIPEDDPELEGKTPSQRLRNTIFVLFRQLQDKKKLREDKSFNDFYNMMMEKAIQKVKNKLD